MFSRRTNLSPAETKALNIASGLLLYCPCVETIWPIVCRSACNVWQSIKLHLCLLNFFFVCPSSIFSQLIKFLSLPRLTQHSVLSLSVTVRGCRNNSRFLFLRFNLHIWYSTSEIADQVPTNTCLFPAVVGARSSPKAAESLRAGAELNSAPPWRPSWSSSSSWKWWQHCWCWSNWWNLSCRTWW